MITSSVLILRAYLSTKAIEWHSLLWSIKYHKQKDADHLLAALREKYVITTDTAKTMKYVGITIKYNKVKHIITLSMPDFITKALKIFGKEPVKEG